MSGHRWSCCLEKWVPPRLQRPCWGTRLAKALSAASRSAPLSVVVCQLVGTTPPLILDLELQGPGEGEITTARRLLARVLTASPRAFEVLTLDALYLEAPLVNLALAVRNIKRAIYEGLEMPFAQSLELEMACFYETMTTEAAKEALDAGIRAYAEGREPRFE